MRINPGWNVYAGDSMAPAVQRQNCLDRRDSRRSLCVEDWIHDTIMILRYLVSAA